MKMNARIPMNENTTIVEELLPPPAGYFRLSYGAIQLLIVADATLHFELFGMLLKAEYGQSTARKALKMLLCRVLVMPLLAYIYNRRYLQDQPELLVGIVVTCALSAGAMLNHFACTSIDNMLLIKRIRAALNLAVTVALPFVVGVAVPICYDHFPVTLASVKIALTLEAVLVLAICMGSVTRRCYIHLPVIVATIMKSIELILMFFVSIFVIKMNVRLSSPVSWTVLILLATVLASLNALIGYIGVYLMQNSQEQAKLVAINFTIQNPNVGLLAITFALPEVAALKASLLPAVCFLLTLSVFGGLALMENWRKILEFCVRKFEFRQFNTGQLAIMPVELECLPTEEVNQEEMDEQRIEEEPPEGQQSAEERPQEPRSTQVSIEEMAPKPDEIC